MSLYIPGKKRADEAKHTLAEVCVIFSPVPILFTTVNKIGTGAFLEFRRNTSVSINRYTRVALKRLVIMRL